MEALHVIPFHGKVGVWEGRAEAMAEFWDRRLEIQYETFRVVETHGDPGTS